MEGPSMDVMRNKPSCSWYVKLESESSSLPSEDDDTESVYSIQGYVTELAQDTPDTDTKSEYSSSSDVDFEVEYEVADLSGEEENPLADSASSSGTEVVNDDVLAAAGAIAAVICDNSMEAWLTDGEDSDNSSAGDTETNHTDYWTCVQCKSQNNNPLFRLCQKCFQMRKTLFPPRPRGHRKRQKKEKEQPKEINLSVQQKTPESADSGISSQESAVGSQDSVTGSLHSGTRLQESNAGSGQVLPIYNLNIATTSNGIGNARGVKRKSEHLVVNGDDSSKRSRTEEVTNGSGSGDHSKQLETHDLVKIDKDVIKEQKKNREETETTFVKPAAIPKYPLYEDKTLCIMCESQSQNSVFLHAGMGCMCCCYKCAIRTWTTHKKCPACTRKVKNVIRINKA